MLPCHPFYGLKVEILQRGKTDTQEWCLIKHPKQLGFHYRPIGNIAAKKTHKELYEQCFVSLDISTIHFSSNTIF